MQPNLFFVQCALDKWGGDVDETISACVCTKRKTPVSDVSSGNSKYKEYPTKTSGQMECLGP